MSAFSWAIVVISALAVLCAVMGFLALIVPDIVDQLL
jgi:hypothetical protein